jgi:2-polyprenyl-6-methoxyphenol hydroxylase-like FAD-dependent oxidoreductase
VVEFEHPDLPAGSALFALEAGIQFGMLHCGRGRMYWFVTKNQAQGNMVPQRERRQRVLSILQGCHPVIREAIIATAETQIIQNDILDRPPTWPWGEGRVTTLGDAIHPTTPNMGQGACQAIEDAVTLPDPLQSIDDVEEALRAYESRRRHRTAFITRQSWSFGRVLQWQNPLATFARNMLFATGFARSQRTKIFERLLLHELPDIGGQADKE